MSLILIGVLLLLVGFGLPRLVKWDKLPDATRSMRNRPGEIISLVLGPILIIVGVVSLFA